MNGDASFGREIGGMPRNQLAMRIQTNGNVFLGYMQKNGWVDINKPYCRLYPWGAFRVENLKLRTPEEEQELARQVAEK